MFESTLSGKNQIVIPKDARQALGVKAGDKLLLVVRGDRVIVFQKPESHHSALKGLANVGYGNEYLPEERQSWE